MMEVLRIDWVCFQEWRIYLLHVVTIFMGKMMINDDQAVDGIGYPIFRQNRVCVYIYIYIIYIYK